MIVFVDSSVICTDFYMQGTYFELLKKECTVVLSEIVIAEVKNKHCEMIEESLRSINKEINILNRMLSSQIEINTENILSEEKMAYNNFIDFFLFGNGMMAAEEYPEIAHKKIVERALQRKKPFKSDGKNGYRDYLVWRSFLSIAKLYAFEEICFMTLNKKDFSDDKDDKKLHPDLLEELDQEGIDRNRIHYWTSLKDFVDIKIKPILLVKEKTQKFVKELLADDKGFIEPLDDMLSKKLQDYSLTYSDVAVYGEDPSISIVEEINIEDIENVSKVSEEEDLLEVKGSVFCTVDSFMLKSELVALSEAELESINVVNSNWNDHSVMIETVMDLNFTIDVIYNASQRTLSGLEISEIDDGNCPYCPYD